MTAASGYASTSQVTSPACAGLHGVGLRPAPQLGPVGASGSITIADLGSIRARIIDHESARTRLALEPTAAQAARLAALLAPGMSQAA